MRSGRLDCKRSYSSLLSNHALSHSTLRSQYIREKPLNKVTDSLLDFVTLSLRLLDSTRLDSLYPTCLSLAVIQLFLAAEAGSLCLHCVSTSVIILYIKRLCPEDQHSCKQSYSCLHHSTSRVSSVMDHKITVSLVPSLPV
jgi:hypothetical protein